MKDELKNKYHNYVYDFERREFIGDFEKMYADETKLNFDSWYQEDQRHIKRRINKVILDDYNFDVIVDFGCGKGTFTHIHKKNNNKVIGVDISKTAIMIAGSRYPDIVFLERNLEFAGSLDDFNYKNNLALFIEILSYLEDWKKILVEAAINFDFCLINLFLPPDPIGFIKTETELMIEILKSFEVIYKLNIENKHQNILFLKSKIKNE